MDVRMIGRFVLIAGLATGLAALSPGAEKPNPQPNAPMQAVVHADYAGVTHEFFGMGAVLDEAKQAVAKAADGLKSAFHK